MKLIALLISITSLNASEMPQNWISEDGRQRIYQQLAFLYGPKANISPEPCSPWQEDDFVLIKPSAPPIEQTSDIPASSTPNAPPLTDIYSRLFSSRPSHLTFQSIPIIEEDSPELAIDAAPKGGLQLFQTGSSPSIKQGEDLEDELSRLKQENKSLNEQLDLVTHLLEENNQMLKVLLSALQENDIHIEGIENSQMRLESDVMSMMDKLKKWKTETLQSNEHPVTKILKWFKCGFHITSSAGTVATTYYTLAWFAGILPAALTPPGWILASTSAAAGAIYYITYAV